MLRWRFHEVTEGTRGQQHNNHRDRDCGDHNQQLIRQADRGEDGIEGKHEIEQHDLDDHGCKPGRNGLRCNVRLAALHRFINLDRPLGQKKQAAAKQNQVAPGEAEIHHRHDRCRQLDQPGDRQQQRDAHGQRQGQTDEAGARPELGRQPLGRDRNKDDVVDPEDDLENRERQEAHPDRGIQHDFDHRLPQFNSALDRDTIVRGNFQRYPDMHARHRDCPPR